MGVKQENNNKHLGLLILLGFILIIAGIVAYIIISYNSDQADIKKRMSEVETGYNTFREDSDKFNDIRDDIYNSVMQDMYYENLKNNDSTYKNLFQEYKSILESIDKDYDDVKDNCINVLYPDVGTNNKCEALISGYEEIVNLYVSDVNSYNKIFHKPAMELGSLEVYVDSAENVEDVLKTIQNLPEIKGKTFNFSTDTADFDLISNPLSSLQKMVDTAVTVIAITGAAVIALLLILWTRGRKKEAGILMAVGRSKVEIVLQFLAENFFIAIPAAAASFGLSVLLADKVGDFLVSQTASDVEGLSVVLHSADMAAVYGVGALILILAVLVASVTVIRLKPKAILTQMD